MISKRRIYVLLIAAVIIAGGLIYNYTFNSKHRTISEEKALFEMSTEVLAIQFETNESEATNNYLDKVLAITGTITEIENTDVILNDKLHVSFETVNSDQLFTSAKVTIKGRCVGYDNLLEMVKIDQATLINQ